MKRKVEEIKDELINSIVKAVSYKSVYTPTISNDAPFGEESKKVLDYVLDLGKSMGFRTKNIDGYCGYIEFGEGDELVGIIGHLDVVPANMEDGWLTDPFKAEIKDNKIYGRGTVDDKGPVMACLYAMKIVSETENLNKRVRLILGMNEETNWECIKRYKQTEELPTISFSPDADFPCIYAEKGMITFSVSNEINLSDDKIIAASSENNAINVVPKIANITIKTKDKTKYHSTNDINIIDIDEETLKIKATGKSAHAAFPMLGDNAITKLLRYINSIHNNDFLSTLENIGFYELENPSYLGGKSVVDETGNLTSNIAVIEYQDNKLILKVNLRVPVKTNFSKIKEYCQKVFSDYNFLKTKEGLYVNKDSYLVNTLTRVFKEETGIDAEPLAIGGGTYAKAFNNCVSFGMTMPNQEDLCHQANENIDIDNLLLATRIYAKAIIELAK